MTWLELHVFGWLSSKETLILMSVIPPPTPPPPSTPPPRQPLPCVCEGVNGSVQAEERFICTDAASTLLSPMAQHHTASLFGFCFVFFFDLKMLMQHRRCRDDTTLMLLAKLLCLGGSQLVSWNYLILWFTPKLSSSSISFVKPKRLQSIKAQSMEYDADGFLV